MPSAVCPESSRAEHGVGGFSCTSDIEANRILFAEVDALDFVSRRQHNTDHEMAEPVAPTFHILPDPEAVKDVEDCYLEGLSNDFRNHADIELVVEGEHNLPCHSAILRLHSRVFDKLLAKETVEESGSESFDEISMKDAFDPADARKQAGSHIDRHPLHIYVYPYIAPHIQ